MRSPLAARLSGDELGRPPRNYGHLLGLAARYARTWLDGLIVVNRETGWPIGLRWSRGLEQAVVPGVPPALLRAVPALPAMLAEARYLGTLEDRPPRLPVRRLHSFAEAAVVAGQPHGAVLIVREDPIGRLFFDGFLVRGPGIVPRDEDAGLLDAPDVWSPALPQHRAPRRQMGGGTPDGAAAPTASSENSFADGVAPATPSATDVSGLHFDDSGEPLPPAPPQPRAPAFEARVPRAGWETLPPGDARDAAQYGYPLDEWRAMQRGEPWVPSRPSDLDHLPELPASAPARIDPHPPWEEIDQEDVWNKRNARMAALKAQGIDPKTDPALAELNRQFAKSIAQNNETAAVIGAPLGGIGRGVAGLADWGASGIGRGLAKAASEIRPPPSTPSPREAHPPPPQRVGPDEPDAVSAAPGPQTSVAGRPAEATEFGNPADAGSQSPRQAARPAPPETRGTAPAAAQGYTVAYTMRLPPELFSESRHLHYQTANDALLRDMEQDPDFAEAMRAQGVVLERTPTGLAPRTPPAGWSWHHALTPGEMQLVPRDQHESGSTLFRVVHPTKKGGYATWGEQ